MNWKQLYALSTPRERLELLCCMLRTLETRRFMDPSPIFPQGKWRRVGVGTAHWVTAAR